MDGLVSEGAGVVIKSGAWLNHAIIWENSQIEESMIVSDGAITETNEMEGDDAT